MTGQPSDGELGRIIGKNLRRERERNELTQKDFAALIGQSRSFITQVENGYVKVPGVHAVYVWASALGVRMEDLMEVPRVEHTSKGRFRAKHEGRQARANGARSLADWQAELERRAERMKAGPYQRPDADDWSVWTEGTELDMDEAIAAGKAHAEKWQAEHPDVPAEAKTAGAFIAGLTVGKLHG